MCLCNSKAVRHYYYYNERVWSFQLILRFYLLKRSGGEEDELRSFCRGKGSFHRAKILAMGSGKFIVCYNPHRFLHVCGHYKGSLLYYTPQRRLHPVDTGRERKNENAYGEEFVLEVVCYF